jgi:SAM-dependent methyltransferase
VSHAHDHLEPLAPGWEGALARALGRPVEPRVLALLAARQSQRYRGEEVPLAPGDARAARCLFFLPRDLPKSQVPIHELALANALPARPLRVLDLGAGLGTTALGVALALPAGTALGELVSMDRDAEALALQRRVWREAAALGLVVPPTHHHTLPRDLTARGWDQGLGDFDLVTVGLCLVELVQGLTDERARGEALGCWCARLLGLLRPDGALVVLEPGDRERARALQHARAVVLAQGVTVFAPCPHAGPCPLLAEPRDWCHEDLTSVTLPPWLVPVAREAGLRWDGPTYAYLTLRRDGLTLAGALARAGERPARLVGRPEVSKGRTAVRLCGSFEARTDALAVDLHRHRKGGAETVLEALPRGAMVLLPQDVRPTDGGTLRLEPGAWRTAP